MESKFKTQEAQKLLKNGIKAILKKNYISSRSFVNSAFAVFKSENSVSDMAICLSLIAFIDYSESSGAKGLELLDEATYLTEKTNNINARIINELIKGNINFCENSKDIALIHYNNALKLSVEDDEYSLAPTINARIKQLQNGMDYYLPTQSDPLVSLVKISRSITALTDIDELLKVIAQETKNAMQADRCTVFLWDKETNELWSKVALGVDESQEIRFPADKGLAGYVVQTGETLNITDAYSDPRFNPEVDHKTGYKTKTILCMPITNNNREIIGAFQILNKIDGIFTQNDEDLLVAIGGSASIALENAQLFDQQLQLYREQKLLFESFIDTLATSIDARDKITAGHSTRVRMYSGLIAQTMGMDKKDINIIEKAATLHDIGKIGIKDSVLQKEGKLTDEEYKHIQEHVRITHNILNKIYMSPDFRIITEIASSHHEKYDGSGYYRHLKGEEITIGGRILAVADVFDAITSKRHYRDKMPIKNVLNILKEGSGKHFDPKIVNLFMSIPLDKICGIFLSDGSGKISKNDELILSNLNLSFIDNYVRLENPSEQEQNIIDLFNKYYIGEPHKQEEN